MAFVQNGDARIYWDQKGAGTPILLVMGHKLSSRLWYPAIDALAAKHRVIWFDNRGAGQSSTTRNVSVATMGDDAFAVMDAAGVDRAHIYGVSMGGVVVIDMALRKPERVRSLIVGCSGILDAGKPRTPKWILPLYFLPMPVLKAMLGRNGDHGYGSAAPADLIAKDQAMAAQDPFTRWGVVRQSLALANYAASKEAVAKLAMSSLVLHGDEDKLVPFSYGEELAAVLPKSTFIPLRGAGHNYFVARGKEANDATLAFLDKVDAASSIPA
jgi:pimeloyl-ACP methyl ester carboxylesterase